MISGIRHQASSIKHRASTIKHYLIALLLSIGLCAQARANDCPADWSQSGSVTTEDLFAFLNDWFAGTGDFNRDGTSSVQDVFDFQNAWFAAGSDPNCGAEPGTMRDPWFTKEYVRPALAQIETSSGFRTFDGDVVVVRRVNGVLEARLWNRDLPGFSAPLPGFTAIETSQACMPRSGVVSGVPATLSRGIMVATIGVGSTSASILGVGLELETQCGGSSSRAWAFVPIASATSGAELLSAFGRGGCDIADPVHPSDISAICITQSSVWTTPGMFSLMAETASRATVNSLQRAAFAARIDPSKAAVQLGYTFAPGSTALAMRDDLPSSQANVVDSAGNITTMGTMTGFQAVTPLAQEQVVTGRTTLDALGAAIPEVLTFNPSVSVATIVGADGGTRHAVVIGGRASLNGHGSCPIWVGHPVAVFSSVESASVFSARLAPESPTVESIAHDVLLTSDIPPGFQPTPGTIVDPTPRDRWPQPGDFMWCCANELGGVDCFFWNNTSLGCWSDFQQELQNALDAYNRAVANCTIWDTGNIIGGAGIGAGCGAGVGACGAVAAIPAAICGGVIGGFWGGLSSYLSCKATAKRVYEVDRDIAIRNYVNCLRDVGICVER